MLSFIKNLFVGKPAQPEVKEEAPYKVEALPAGTEAANVTAVYIAPEAAAMTPIPLVVEALEAVTAKKPAKPKALPKIKVPKAPK
jgi:hypothetical protein